MIELQGDAGASGLLIGLGLWVFVAWVWVGTRGRDLRGEALAVGGIVLAASFLGGWVGSALVGESGLSSLGALAGGASAIILAPGTKLVSWQERADELVGPGLAALGVARMGCFFTGCDFGRPTTGGWGVVYGARTRAWETQVIELGLSPYSDQTGPLHLFALYLGGWGLLSAFVAVILSRGGLKPGQAGCFSAAFFLTGGAIIEYTREPATVLQLSPGLSVYPFIYVVGGIIAVAAGFYCAPRGAERLKGRG